MPENRNGPDITRFDVEGLPGLILVLFMLFAVGTVVPLKEYLVVLGGILCAALLVLVSVRLVRAGRSRR